MRRALLSLFGLLWLVHVAVPALPGFVCRGMGGVHLLHPCCPQSERHDGPALTASCCDPSPRVALEPTGENGRRSLLPPPATAAHAAAPPAPRPAVHRDAPLPRSQAPPGLPPDRPLVLRI